jgi:transcriptional regulator MraZ
VFRGVQSINMDAKGRLAIPTRQRDRLKDDCDGEVVITVDTQSPCLAIYPLPVWESLEQEIQDLPALKPEVKRFQRLVLGYATDLQLDANGRLLLPQSLREWAKLEKKLILAGQGKKLELWSEELWNAEVEADLGSGELPAELLSLRL